MAGPQTPSMSGGRFTMDIDGYNAGFLKKFSGLGMVADIVSNDMAPLNINRKHVANIKWETGKATVGMGMGKGMYDWIKAAFDRNFLTKNGSVTSADFNHKATSRMDFINALIVGVTVPKLDGSSKDAGFFDIEFEAEQVRWYKGGGEDIRAKVGTKQKAWLCSNFRCEIGGLPNTRIASVDSFTWKCGVAADQVGITRESAKLPTKLTVPDLKVAVSMADHEAWAQAAKKWFVDGHHLEEDEMTGQITFLGPDMSKELGNVGLENVGFKKFEHDAREANTDKVARFNVEFYVENMRFNMAYTDE